MSYHKFCEGFACAITQIPLFGNLMERIGPCSFSRHSHEDSLDIVKILREQRFIALAEEILKEFLKIAGGINDPTYSESMYLNKIQIVRRSFSEEYPSIILVDIEN